MIDIKKFPIIIISSPRTGSTPLAFEFKNRYNVKLFNELFTRTVSAANQNIHLDDQLNLLSFIENNNNNFILKFHVKELYKYPKDILKMIENHQCTLIRIRRRDIVSQIASFYIETKRDIWGYYKKYNKTKRIDEFINSEIPINFTLIECIGTIIDINDTLDKLTFSFDNDIWYEDLIFKDETFITTPKPKNYNLIKETIKTYIEQRKIK
jgi:hypothetical protein